MQFYPDYAAAIAGNESAGQADPYQALGPVTKNGDRAFGKYQMMGNNIPEWSEQYLGQRMTAQELLSHPKTSELQDKLFNSRFGDYLDKFGNPQDAASAWFTGRPLAQGGQSADILGTTGNAYVDKFNRNLLAQQNGKSPMTSAFADARSPMTVAMDANGPAKPDADGAYGSDAVMLQANPIMQAMNSRLPANSTPTAGDSASLPPPIQQAMQQQDAPASLFPQRGGMFGQDFGNKLQSLGASMVSVSNPSAGANLMANAKDQRALSMQRDAQESSFRSLVQRGVPPAEAAAAALNPDIMKAVAGKYFDAKPFSPVDMGTDPLTGMKRMGAFNPATGKFVDPGNSSSGAGPAFDMDKLNAAIQSGAPPEQLKAMLPPVIRSEIESMIKGEASAQTLSRSGPSRTAIVAIAHAIDPTFDETTFQARQKLASGLAQVGPSSFGGQKTSGNMMIHHLDDLDKAIDGLPNTNIPALNAIGNWGSVQFGNTAVQNAVKNFTQKREVVATELPKFLRGAGAAEADVEHIRNTLSTADSPEALRTAVRGFIGSIRGRLEPLTNTYNDAFRRNESPDFFLGPKEREIVKRLESSTVSTPAASSGGFKVLKVH